MVGPGSARTPGVAGSVPVASPAPGRATGANGSTASAASRAGSVGSGVRVPGSGAESSGSSSGTGAVAGPGTAPGSAPGIAPASRARADWKSPGAAGAPDAVAVAGVAAAAAGAPGGVAVVEVITVHRFPSSEGGQGRLYLRYVGLRLGERRDAAVPPHGARTGVVRGQRERGRAELPEQAGEHPGGSVHRLGGVERVHAEARGGTRHQLHQPLRAGRADRARVVVGLHLGDGR